MRELMAVVQMVNYVCVFSDFLKMGNNGKKPIL